MQPNKKEQYARGELSAKLIEYYQKQSKCVHFTQSAINMIVRPIALGLTNRKKMPNLRFTRDAMATVHILIEQYVVNLFKNANVACIHSGRTTIMPKDIQVVRHITGERL
jgi:histone H3/H4